MSGWLVLAGWTMFFAVLGICAARGWVVDTRDTEYSLGRLIAHRPAPDERERRE